MSAHLFATDPRFGFIIEGYSNELLKLAHDLGKRLLPAFQKSKTGIPYARVSKGGILFFLNLIISFLLCQILDTKSRLI